MSWTLSSSGNKNRVLMQMPCEDCGRTIFERPSVLEKGLRKYNKCRPCSFSYEKELRIKRDAYIRSKFDVYEEVIKLYATGFEDGGAKAREVV